MSETEILTPAGDRAEAIRRTFMVEHPKATDTVVTMVEGMTYRIETGGAVFRADLLDGGTRVTFTLADPGDVHVDLAPPSMRRLVGPSEPVVEPDPALFDVNASRGRALRLLDQLRHLAERVRLNTRHVATSHSDEVARLSSLVPADAVDASYKPLNHNITLLRMSREAVETVALLADLRGVLSEAEIYRRAVSPKLRDALMELATARSGSESLAAVGSLSNLGQLAVDRFSQREVNLDDLGDKLDVLRRAVEEVNPLVVRFEEAVKVHAGAMLHTARLAACQNATMVLTKLRAAAQTVRTVGEAEVLAAEAAERVGVTAPRLIWSSDPLAPPKLG